MLGAFSQRGVEARELLRASKSTCERATSKRTFGYHRVTILTALFNAVSLVALSVWIGIEALQHFLRPEPVAAGLMIWVALIAVAMNTVIAAALAGDAKNSLNSRAAYVHMAGDAISSAAVVLAGVAIHFTGWVYADPLVSLLIAAFIVYTAWGIVSDAVSILMENTPKNVDAARVVASLKSVAPVCDVHDLHIWAVGDGLNFLSCHVSLPAQTSLRQIAAIVGALNKKLHDEHGIGHTTIQTELEGVCASSEDIALYCAMETHQHGAGEEHDEEEHNHHAQGEDATHGR